MTARLMLDQPIVVAGGAGFLGSHLCERYVRRGESVLCLDNFLTGSMRNIERLLDESRFTVHRWDVAEPLLVIGIRGICNLACPASPVHYQTDPIRTTMTSVRGTYHMLELARSAEAPLMQASTSEVYGDPQIHPQQ